MKILITGLSLGLGLALAGNAHAACSAQDLAALEKLDHDWSDAARSGNRAALEAIYSEGFMDLAVGSGADKRTTIDWMVEDAAKGDMGPMPKSDFYRISCDGNSALITHRNAVTEGEGDKARTWYGRSIHHMVRENGKWRVLGNAGHPLGDGGVVTYLDLEWNLAELAGDKAWFERMLADDYIGVSSRTGEVETKAELIASLGTYKVTQADSTDVEVNVHGDNAIVTGIYHTRGTDPDGKAFMRKTRYIDTFIRRDGRWQVWSSQGTEVK